MAPEKGGEGEPTLEGKLSVGMGKGGLIPERFKNNVKRQDARDWTKTSGAE